MRGIIYLAFFVRETHQTVQQLAVSSSGSFIKCVHELRLLDVLLSNDLKWHAHASCTRKAINSMIGTINHYGNTLNMNTHQRIIVNAFIIPTLNYALLMWCWLNKTDENAFNHTILRCTRIITHSKTVELNATTYALTGLTPFSPMSSIRCVM